jgi:hypothetical protein
VANIQTATSATPQVLVAQYIPTMAAAQYTAIAGTTVQVTSCAVTNTDTVPRTVTLSIVNSGGTGGVPNTVLQMTLTSGQTVNIPEFWLGEGDFIWASAGTASTITLVMTGIVFSASTSGAASGIQDDARGTGGHGTATVTGTNEVGTGTNRYLFGALLVQEGGVSTAWSAYSSLSMTDNDGSGPVAMTRLVSIDFSNTATIQGSVHLFGRANPTSGVNHTLAAAAAASGATMNLVLGSISKSGVASVTGAVSANTPSSVAALSLAITSATLHVPMFAGAFYNPPQDFNLRTKYFNGVTSGFTYPQWLLMADALGAATVTATTSNSTEWAAVGIDVVPA